MDPSRVDVVLVRPARPANVAAACRAMKNMGLRRLRLVGGPEGETMQRADVRALAYGAWDVLDGAERATSLAGAVSDAALVVGTSSRGGEGSWTARRLALEGASRAGGGRVAVVFGPEASGLTGEELALCHQRVHVPTDPAQPSLNLAQAVLVVAYEIAVGAREEVPAAIPAQASAGEIEAALGDLGRGLLGIGYLNPRNPEGILGEIRGLLVRASPTPREASLLRGIARQILWAAGRIATVPGGDG
ncbi:MAG: RNA methyltransferase [Acidobacteria bacterium]|nr:RNA methyltransferase [Acidobacteriota bacterium]